MWLLILGLLIGSLVGFAAASLCVAAKQGDKIMEEEMRYHDEDNKNNISSG